MFVGILSDTHGFVHPELHTCMAGADVLLHAGDVGSMDVLDELKLIAPVRAVYGNVDGGALRYLPGIDRFELDGVRFCMTHIAGHPGRWQQGMGRVLAEDPPDVFVCGHSHILRVERVAVLNRMLYINPGAAGRQGIQQVKSCIRLYLADGRTDRAEVVHLDP